jgi:hypothetical protein
MTGNLADADQHAVELASVPILSKPFTLAQLRETVEQMLRTRMTGRHPSATTGLGFVDLRVRTLILKIPHMLLRVRRTIRCHAASTRA